MRSPL